MVSINYLNRVLGKENRNKEAGIMDSNLILSVIFSSTSRLFYIRLPFNCRPPFVMPAYCCRNASVPGSSNKKSYNRSFSALPVIQRMFESNQYNNLSPPLLSSSS